MKAYIHSDGDNSVGINASETIVESNFDFENDDDREDIRQKLKLFFNEFHDNGQTHVRFDDERDFNEVEMQEDIDDAKLEAQLIEVEE